jgi:hypothetical protein
MARAPPVADSNQRCGVRVTDERDRSRRARRGSGGESLAALGAATSQYGATVFCRHAGAKAMCTLALENAGLECPFHSSLRSTSSARVSAGMINRYVGCARHFRSSLALISAVCRRAQSKGARIVVNSVAQINASSLSGVRRLSRLSRKGSPHFHSVPRGPCRRWAGLCGDAGPCRCLRRVVAIPNPCALAEFSNGAACIDRRTLFP